MNIDGNRLILSKQQSLVTVLVFLFSILFLGYLGKSYYGWFFSEFFVDNVSISNFLRPIFRFIVGGFILLGILTMPQNITYRCWQVFASSQDEK